MGRHKEWRKAAKKIMRKRKRVLKAEERDEKIKIKEEKRAQSPSYKSWLEEQERLELFREEEEQRLREELNKRWLHEEEVARERWLKQQKRLERLKAEKAKQELIIREEWEREQEKLRGEAEAQERENERKQREQAELQDRIEKYIAGESDRLPSSTRIITETQPGCQDCPFFSKVAACRFRDNCSRNHIRPSISRTVLLPGFYSHFRMEHNLSNEYDTDVGLEYDDKEIYQDFLEFYNDVLTELKTFGPVVQFKVCCNEEPHLRGNVYIQYSEERCAIKAVRALQGRFYGGKRISAEFCNIESWSRALCGLFSRNKCPKGGKCNFLHVFRNPDREFYHSDRDAFKNKLPARDDRERTDWSWSPAPESNHRSKRESTRRDTHYKHQDRSSHNSNEKQNWDWSPSPEPIRNERDKSSSYKENYSGRHSERENRRDSHRSASERYRRRDARSKSKKRNKSEEDKRVLNKSKDKSGKKRKTNSGTSCSASEEGKT